MGSSSSHVLGPAFTYVAPQSLPMPVLVAVPHAGRAYPATVLAHMRDPDMGQKRLEDRHVDRLGIAIAKATRAGLLVANAPRAMLDLNRASDDIDWDMIEGGAALPLKPEKVHSGQHRRSRTGLGLIPRRLSGFGEIWRGQISREELDRRIDKIHRPYHAFLARELSRIRDEWGAALLIDLHSMPPLRKQAGQDRVARMVLGDRFGTSCQHSLVAQAMSYLDRRDMPVAHNRPYSGGYVLDRQASPPRGIHAIQVEVCRTLYLDSQFDEPSSGLRPLADMLAGLLRELGAETARIGRIGEMAQAAE